MTVTHSPHIDLAGDLRGFFKEVLLEALAERRVEVTETTAQYLVALLTAFAHPDELSQQSLERPLPLLLEEALASAGGERFERLRSLGDTVLYTSGFFVDHLETRGVQLTYVQTMGARAYGSAASMLRTRGATDAVGEPALFEELADKFGRCAEVLGRVADGLYATSQLASHSGALKLYERWLRTGSAPLAAALAARGMTPSRGAGGLH